MVQNVIKSGRSAYRQKINTSSETTWPGLPRVVWSCQILEVMQTWPWLVFGWKATQGVQGCYAEAVIYKPPLHISCIENPTGFQLQLDNTFHHHHHHHCQ